MSCRLHLLQNLSPTRIPSFLTPVSNSSWHRSFPTWCMTSALQLLMKKMILLLLHLLNFPLPQPCSHTVRSLLVDLLLLLPNSSLGVSPLRLLLNLLVLRLSLSPSHPCLQLHLGAAAVTALLRSSKVSPLDIHPISLPQLFQSNTAFPPKTWPCPHPPPPPPFPSQLLPPLWSNRSSISFQETLPHYLLLLFLPQTPLRVPNSTLLSLLQLSRPNQSGSQEE